MGWPILLGIGCIAWYRSNPIDDIDMILSTSKCKSVPTLSEHLLLAPTWDSNLSKKEDVAIKVTLLNKVFE